MGWRSDRITKKVERINGPVASNLSTDKIDTVCTFCSAGFNIGQDGGHHFPPCDVVGCNSLEHAGCRH